MMPFYGRKTMGTGVRGSSGLHLTRSDAQQVALVLEHTPQLAPDSRVVAPVAEAPAHPPTASNRFEGGQVLPTNQPTIVEQHKQDQQVGSQMRQFAIASLIFFPTEFDPCFIRIDAFLPLLKMRG